MSIPDWKIWNYTNMGRTFIIDTTLGRDSNILNAVLEVLIPVEKEPGEHPLAYKRRILIGLNGSAPMLDE